MRILFLGDVMGRTGRAVVLDHLADLKRRWSLDCVVVNGENAAGGFGITEAICRDLIEAGADAVTLGNHSWDQREALVFIAREPRLIRPVNLPPTSPGRGAALIDLADGRRVLVVNVLTRLFMDPMDDPFAALDREIGQCPLRQVSDAIIIDVHGEATSEKQAIGVHLDGRASVVVGTHTHVPTADARLLLGGTAYQSDAGMCGDYDSVIGFQKEEPVRRFIEKTPGVRWGPAEGEATLCGLAVETNDATGLAVKVAAVRIGPHLAPSLPDFWP